MKKIGTIIGLKLGLAIFCAVATMSSAAFAEDAKPAAPAISADDLKKALGLSIYLQAGYTYNGNAGTVGGESEQNDYRVFDHKANSFTLDLAQIVFVKDPALGNAGYKLKLSAGETAKWIHSRGLSGAPLTSPQAGEGTDSFDVTEAYISYNAAVGKGLRFDLGKFATFFGAEVIEAIDNPNYSRSFLFNYAIPFTHTGLKASYALSDTLSAAVYLVNGWDDSTDNNRGKSYGVSVTYAPAELFSLIVNGMTGPEQDEQGVNAPTVGSSSSNTRNMLDIIATIKPIKPLAIILNYDDGREDNVPGTLLPSGISGDAKWDGLAGIIKYDFNDTYSLAVRGEYFDDKDGFRTGMVQKLKEVTVTPEIRLNGGVILRPEYRHDTSDKTSFDIVNGAATKKSQDTIALGAMYRW
ncbi:MAG TPA: porin [Nitrospirota bacterium]|nr:porin [Nitrospirota bacterium]